VPVKWTLPACPAAAFTGVWAPLDSLFAARRGHKCSARNPGFTAQKKFADFAEIGLQTRAEGAAASTDAIRFAKAAPARTPCKRRGASPGKLTDASAHAPRFRNARFAGHHGRRRRRRASRISAPATRQRGAGTECVSFSFVSCPFIPPASKEGLDGGSNARAEEAACTAAFEALDAPTPLCLPHRRTQASCYPRRGNARSRHLSCPNGSRCRWGSAAIFSAAASTGSSMNPVARAARRIEAVTPAVVAGV
jgi:hypothetical protein